MASTREKNNYYFRVRLEKGRLDEILGSPEELLRLRHDYGKLKSLSKILRLSITTGSIWRRR